MIDLNLIRKKTDEVKTALLKRMDHLDFSELLKWDKERRELISGVDKLKEKRQEKMKILEWIENNKIVLTGMI